MTTRRKIPKAAHTTALVGERVSVHWHLTKKCFSVTHKGLVKAHVSQVYLKGAEFRVGQKGWKRAVAQKRRNVHARVYGELIEALPEDVICERRVRYNAFETEGLFIDAETEQPVHEALFVMFVDGAIWIP